MYHTSLCSARVSPRLPVCKISMPNLKTNCIQCPSSEHKGDASVVKITGYSFSIPTWRFTNPSNISSKGPNTFNPSTQEAKSDHYEFEANLVYIVSSGQPGLHSETFSRKDIYNLKLKMHTHTHLMIMFKITDTTVVQQLPPLKLILKLNHLC